MNGFYIVGMTSFAFFAEYGWHTWDRLRASRATSAEIIVGKALPLLRGIDRLQFLDHLRDRRPALPAAQPRTAHRTCPLVVAFATLPRDAGRHDHRDVPQHSAGERVAHSAASCSSARSAVPSFRSKAFRVGRAPSLPSRLPTGSCAASDRSSSTDETPAQSCCHAACSSRLSFALAAVSLARFRFSDAKVSF